MQLINDFDLMLAFLGGRSGSLARWLVGLVVRRHYHGAFLIGLVMVLTAKNTQNDWNIQLFTVTGIMGGLSTFSTLVWGTLMLWQEQGQYWIGWLYLLISMGSGLVMVELGTR